MTRSDRVSTLEEAKAHFQKSWDKWKSWAKLEEARGQGRLAWSPRLCENCLVGEAPKSEAHVLLTPSRPARPQEDSPPIPGRKARFSNALTIVLVLLVLAGLPVAVWLDLRNLSERALREQADDL